MGTALAGLPSARRSKPGVGWSPVMAVVELSKNQKDEFGPRMDRVDQRGNAGMVEGGIPDGGDNRAVLAPHPVGVVEPGRLADGCAHAEDGVDRAQVEAQGVTADVAGIDRLGQGFADRVKSRAMGAAGAEGRPPGLSRRLRLFRGRQARKFPQRPLRSHRGRVLPGEGPNRPIFPRMRSRRPNCISITGAVSSMIRMSSKGSISLKTAGAGSG